MTTPTVLKVTPRKEGVCTHPVLRFISEGKWGCALCQAEVTDLELIDQKHERRNNRQS